MNLTCTLTKTKPLAGVTLEDIGRATPHKFYPSSFRSCSCVRLRVLSPNHGPLHSFLTLLA